MRDELRKYSAAELYSAAIEKALEESGPLPGFGVYVYPASSIVRRFNSPFEHDGTVPIPVVEPQPMTSGSIVCR